LFHIQAAMDGVPVEIVIAMRAFRPRRSDYGIGVATRNGLTPAIFPPLKRPMSPSGSN